MNKYEDDDATAAEPSLNTFHELQEFCQRQKKSLTLRTHVHIIMHVIMTALRPPARTIIIDFAIVVFVSVLHQLFDVVLSDGLSGGLQHGFQLLQVDVAVSVPAHRQQSGAGLSGGLFTVRPSSKEKKPSRLMEH